LSDPILIYFNGTFINRENGAHARVSELLDFAIATGRKIIVYSYYEHPACPWRQRDVARFRTAYPDVDLVLESRGRLLRLATTLKLRLIALMPQLAARLLPLSLKGLTPVYDRLRARHPTMRTLVNYAHGLAELNGVDPSSVVIETHDLNFLNAAKALQRPLTSVKTMLKARMEFELLSKPAGLIAIAPPEAAIFRLFYPNMPVYLVPAYQLPSAEIAEEDVCYDILFVGSENTLNVDGLCGFIASHRAWLSERSMAVVGRVCSVERVREAVGDLPRVDLLGYVDDLTTLMRRCCLLISPVDGTGLKIKAFEALAAGLPVFGSRGTLDGLPRGYEDCAFEIDPVAMDVLITDGSRRRRAREAAILYARQLVANDDLDRLRSLLADGGATASIRPGT
jgi:glycosyltransferase involved in cell wall biosynthesis